MKPTSASTSDLQAAPPARGGLGFLWLAAFLWAHWALGCLAIYHQRPGPTRSPAGGIYSLGFEFGPLVQSLVETGEYRGVAFGVAFTGHRMPLVPYFLAGVAIVRNDLLVALLLKNLLAYALLTFTLWRARPLAGRLPARWIAAAACFVLTFPHFAHFALLLDVEEAYLLWILFCLFAHLQLLARAGPAPAWGAPTWVALAALNAALFLIKSSMLPVSVAFVGLFFAATRDRRVLAAFAAALAVAAVGWAGHNAHHSGRWTASSSFNGWNLYKGTNASTEALYPTASLDALDRGGPTMPPAGIADEWELDAYYLRQSRAFAAAEPATVARLIGTKAYVLLVEPRTRPRSLAAGRVPRLAHAIAIPYMVAFRVALLVAIACAVRDLFRHRPTDRCWRGERLAAAGFLLIVGSYSIAYVLGFAYTRHAIPLLLPTIAHLAYLLDARRAAAAPVGQGRLQTVNGGGNRDGSR